MTSTVNPVTGSSTAAASSAANTSTNSIGGLTMSDFLTLMTAQLQNQDPLDPTDSNQFLSQLSELSTVEGISQLNTTETNLSNSLLSSQAVSSASLVGQTILAPASSVSYTSGSTLTGEVQVPSGASAVTLTITDADGNVVGQTSLSPSAGMQGFSWNGTNGQGTAVASGVYNISATAEVSGAAQAATTYLSGTVSSITLGSSGTAATLNSPQLGAVPLSSVQQID